MTPHGVPAQLRCTRAMAEAAAGSAAPGEWHEPRHQPRVFEHCVSLGPSCHAAAFLQAHPAGLRRFALPFAWLPSSAAIVATSLADGCAALLDRSQLEPVGAGGKRASRHRSLQADTKPLFTHHAPASSDADFRYLHRAADRLRRVLDDGQRRTLFLHLHVDAPLSLESRAAFLRDADTIFAALRLCRPGNFKVVMVRAVQRTGPAPAGGRCEVLRAAGAPGGAELTVLELTVRTKTVVPMAGAGLVQDPEAEQADLAELTAAVTAQHVFALRPPPPLTNASRMARAACGPAWLQPGDDGGWAKGGDDRALLAAEVPVGELVWAAAQALAPNDSLTASPLQLAAAVWASECLPAVERAQLAERPARVDEWAAAFVGTPGYRRRQWKAAGLRLMLPVVKPRTEAELVARVMRYQLLGCGRLPEEVRLPPLYT